ncbi:MAG: hypothetical protein EOP83_23450 [Verrucomicrobiaceae bacterium]|nr:MAG: hypothetical protein EOP83_23450 [Verrucomicrobiaceae bacterium]
MSNRLKIGWHQFQTILLFGRHYTGRKIKDPHTVEVMFTAHEPEAVRVKWCEANIMGKFTIETLDLVPEIPAYRMAYRFSNPNDAFAFKMRWG